MSENRCPNPMSRSLRQTTLVFSADKPIGLDLGHKPKPPKNKRKQTKKKCPEVVIDSEVVTIDDTSDDQNDGIDEFPKNAHNECKPSTSKRKKCVDPEESAHEEVVTICDTTDDSIDANMDDPIPDVKQEVDIDSDAEEETIDKNLLLSDYDIPLELKLDLIQDCNENHVLVPALKTRKEVQMDCLSLGLELNIDDSDDESDDDCCVTYGTKYEVESIYEMGVNEKTKVIEYLVKWKNWAKEHNTWEPTSNLSQCKQLLQEFRHIHQLKDTQLMEIYHNYYKLKAIVEDMCEKKLDMDVMTALLVAFNDISLKSFAYSKTSVKKLRIELKAKHLSRIDKISEITNTERRVTKMQELFNKLMRDLNLNKRFQSFDDFNEFYIKRKQTQHMLSKWENGMNDIIQKEREGQVIKLENYVDLEVPPHHFEYISKCKTFDKSIQISDDPPLYCENCEDCESPGSGCCVESNNTIIVYNRNKSTTIFDSRKYRNAIYECNSKCKCTQDCINRVVQKGRKHKIAIFKTDDNKGWGVRALEPIPKGSFVMEYIGEIITIEEADRRGRQYDAEGITYLFDLDYNDEVDAYKYALDATHCGNVSHFVNHSCDPNLDTRVVWINNLDPYMPHIALFAIRNIRVNEELTFDYKINVQRMTNANDSSICPSEVSFDSGIDGSTVCGKEQTREEQSLAVACRCGANNCRQVLYSLPSI